MTLASGLGSREQENCYWKLDIENHSTRMDKADSKMFVITGESQIATIETVVYQRDLGTDCFKYALLSIGWAY